MLKGVDLQAQAVWLSLTGSGSIPRTCRPRQFGSRRGSVSQAEAQMLRLTGSGCQATVVRLIGLLHVLSALFSRLFQPLFFSPLAVLPSGFPLCCCSLRFPFVGTPFCCSPFLLFPRGGPLFWFLPPMVVPLEFHPFVFFSCWFLPFGSFLLWLSFFGFDTLSFLL